MKTLLNSTQTVLLSGAAFTALGVFILPSLLAPGRLSFRLPRFRKPEQSGITIGTQEGKLFVSDDERLRHTQIVGATGSGKTVLMESLIRSDIERGLGLLIIDAKGDRELFERVKLVAMSVGREGDLKLLSATHVSESLAWNPCRHGDAGQVQSKIFLSGVYDNPFYEKACEGLLLKSCNALVAKGEAFTLRDVLNELQSLPLKADHKEHALGLIYDIENFLDGAYGEVLLTKQAVDSSEVPPITPKSEITLFDVIRRNEILFVDLPTESRELESKRFGKMLLQELKFLSGLRKTHPKLFSENTLPFSVYIDEFDAFASESFITFLNKGRSSRFMIHVAHQTLSDLARVSPHFESQLTGNINTRFVFRQDNPDDAEKWSKTFGTALTCKSTHQTVNGTRSGTGSVRETQEFKIHPDTIKELKVGECIYSSKTASSLFKGPVLKKIQIKLHATDRNSTLAAVLPRAPSAVICTVSNTEVSKKSIVQVIKPQSPFDAFLKTNNNERKSES